MSDCSLMSRPTVIDDEAILKAARALFLEKGIRATTAEVARKAGVAEGSIFKRWKTKEELFIAAMQSEMAFTELFDRAQTGDDVQSMLVALGHSIIGFYRQKLPVIIMAWSNRTDDDPPHFLRGPNSPPVRGLKMATSFFEAQMRARRICRHDPEIVARQFIGALQNYVFFELIMRSTEELPLSEETFVRGLVNVLWRGLDPQKD
jgi:AcrR family transcriptional regulator